MATATTRIPTITGIPKTTKPAMNMFTRGVTGMTARTTTGMNTLTATPTGTTMSTDGPALYRLMTWLSPSYPVGAFSYSQGLETAVRRGLVRDRDSTRDWLADSLDSGVLWSDAVIAARAHDAACAGDLDALEAIAGFAAAFFATAELKLESLAQGRAFAATTAAAWPCDTLDALISRSGGELPYCVAVAAAASGHGIARLPAVEAFLHAGVSNQVSAAIRLVPLGQSDGQAVIAELEGAIALAAEAAAATPLDALATACFTAEICSMLHETDETRLFRS